MSRLTCPDCHDNFTLPSGFDGQVHCLSYIYADGRTVIATTRQESVAVYRRILEATKATFAAAS